MNTRIAIILTVLLAGGVGVTGCSRHDSPAAAPVKIAKFHCPMHPQVTSNQPGNCPICGMNLVPITAAATSGTVTIAPEARQRMGLTLGVVERRRLSRVIRTSARIVPDETRLWHVTLKAEGWIGKLFAATTGQRVTQGEPLLTIWSPELLVSQQNLLSAVRSGSSNDIANARQRLATWNVSDEQIERIIRTGSVEQELTMVAPVSGWIIARNVAAGHMAQAGEMLLTLADLSVVWADADIYEPDLPFVRVGMPVVVAAGSQTVTGAVTFVSPVLDPDTRTAKARVEIPNPDLALKLEMFGIARLAVDLGDQLAIPETAVMRTSERVYTFRDAGDGKLEPVELKLGARADGWFEVLAGLAAGDKVVTSANFLVDSESQLKAALAGMTHQY